MPKTESLEAWLIFQGEKILLASFKNTYTLPVDTALSQLKTNLLRQHHLGEFNRASCYCAEISSDINLPVGIKSVSLRNAFEYLGIDWYAAAAKAYSVINWDRNHQYCGRCGHLTTIKSGTFERICPQCGLSQYPRISPSMIVLIKKGDELLMARSPHFPPGVYGLIAGFVEVGESIEDAVHREIKEEVGITIKNLQYFGSQLWPFPDSLMIAFTADYASGDLVIDHQEIEEANWYRYDKIPGRPGTSISIASKLIDAFIKEKSNGNL